MQQNETGPCHIPALVALLYDILQLPQAQNFVCHAGALCAESNRVEKRGRYVGRGEVVKYISLSIFSTTRCLCLLEMAGVLIVASVTGAAWLAEAR